MLISVISGGAVAKQLPEDIPVRAAEYVVIASHKLHVNITFLSRWQ
jgi:hypothetical protein